MAPTREPDDLVELFEAQVVGKTIGSFEVHGINALKSVDPPPSALVGASVRGAKFTGDLFTIDCGSVQIDVDLARTGGVVGPTTLGPWVRSGAAIPPTGRLLFSDGSGVEFQEPGRTKRITFTLRQGDVSR